MQRQPFTGWRFALGSFVGIVIERLGALLEPSAKRASRVTDAARTKPNARRPLAELVQPIQSVGGQVGDGTGLRLGQHRVIWQRWKRGQGIDRFGM
jgi:hypothetical protein